MGQLHKHLKKDRSLDTLLRVTFRKCLPGDAIVIGILSVPSIDASRIKLGCNVIIGASIYSKMWDVWLFRLEYPPNTSSNGGNYVIIPPNTGALWTTIERPWCEKCRLTDIYTPGERYVGRWFVCTSCSIEKVGGGQK